MIKKGIIINYKKLSDRYFFAELPCSYRTFERNLNKYDTGLMKMSQTELPIMILFLFPHFFILKKGASSEYLFINSLSDGSDLPIRTERGGPLLSD